MSSDRGVVLVGLGPTTASALAALAERFTVKALVRSANDEVAAYARARGIRIEANTSPSRLAGLVDELAPAAVVVSSYDRVLPEALISTVPFINVHYAPLPRYRGRATVNWAILNGEPETAVTIHCLTAGLDAGGILVQQFVPIGDRDTVTGLYEKLNAIQRVSLAEAVERRIAGDPGLAQDESAATYTCGRIPADGLIDWSRSTTEIDRLVRALGGAFPPAFSFLDSQQIDIVRAHPCASDRTYVGRIPGRVVRIGAGGEVDVLTGDGALTIDEVSIPGGEAVPAGRLIRSHRSTLGLGPLELARALHELQRADRPERQAASSPALVP